MSKALKNIATREHKQLNKEQLAEILAISNGDVRSAINSLQFFEQKGEV